MVESSLEVLVFERTLAGKPFNKEYTSGHLHERSSYLRVTHKMCL